MDEDFFKELLNLSLQMAQTRTLEPLLAYAMRAALKLVGAEYGYLVLHNPNGSFDFRVSLDKHGQVIDYPETQVSQTIINKVISTQKPLVLSNALDDVAFGQAQSVIGLRLRSVMCVPLTTYRLTLGAIYVENRAEAEIFKNEDVKPLSFFATQAAVFIENAILNDNLEEQVRVRTKELQESQANLQALNQRLQAELILARKIQQGLLPPAQPDWSHLDVICYSVPAHEVGGDLYAYHAFNLPIGDSSLLNLDPVGSYGLAVGDVSGKGLPAALLMGVSLALFESAMRQEFGPDELLTYLDGALAPYTQTTHQNCALVYVEITTPAQNREGTMRIVNAGCISPFIKRHTGQIEAPEVGGFALGQGLASAKGFQEVSLGLSNGDIIILTSDGVVEANNAAGEMFGFDRLKVAIAGGPTTGARAMLDHLQAEVAAFVGAAKFHDDLTIVVAQV